jgi:YegS/Rv2252/BmrU family lipid kinase
MAKEKAKKVFLIVNKYAGHKNGKKAKKVVVPYLKLNGFEVEHVYTLYRGHATQLSQSASSQDYCLVVAIGGDGTVNEVAQGLIGKDIPMGIIPMGSGNGLARELGISMKVEEAMVNLVKGNDKLIDVCRINKQRFLCTAGIGFDAQIALLMSKAETRGFWRYLQLVVRESLIYKPLNVKIRIDGKLIEKSVFLITFANASQFGNNAFIAPLASMTDGLIDVVIVRKFSKIWLPLFGAGLFLRFLPKLSFVESYKAKTIEIEVFESSIFHFDGEPGELSIPAKIKIDSEKIWIRS